MIGTNVVPWATRRHFEVHASRNLACRVQAHRPYGWGTTDAYLNLARELGVFVLPILKWEKPRPQTAAEWGEWHNFIGEAVQRYPNQVWWQVWNEPNNSRVPEWTFPDPASYRYFMNDSAQYMKSINPNVKIVSGGIACGGHGSRHVGDNFNWNWVKQNWSVDRVAIHTYVSTVTGAINAINKARQVSSLPIWCTELGRKAAVDGEKRQAAWFSEIHRLTPRVPKFWFNFKAGEDAPTFDSFSAIRADWTRRPVFWKLAEAAKV